MDCKIISTGSQGNAVLIQNTILIDCGVPFSRLTDDYKNLKLVLLTHSHGDHFNPSTLRRLARERPTLRFACCVWLCAALVNAGVKMSQIDVIRTERWYNYKKHWLAAYWQQCGIHVVPTLCWSNEQSYEWCFDGEPQHSIVAISSVGTQKSKQNQALFEKGVRAALARLEPSEILWYGKCHEEFDWNVTRIQPYYKQVKRRCKNGW